MSVSKERKKVAVMIDSLRATAESFTEDGRVDKKKKKRRE